MGNELSVFISGTIILGESQSFYLSTTTSVMHGISGTLVRAGEGVDGVDLCIRELGSGSKPMERAKEVPEVTYSGTFDNVRNSGVSDSKTFTLSPVVFPIPITPHWSYPRWKGQL